MLLLLTDTYQSPPPFAYSPTSSHIGSQVSGADLSPYIWWQLQRDQPKQTWSEKWVLWDTSRSNKTSYPAGWVYLPPAQSARGAKGQLGTIPDKCNSNKRCRDSYWLQPSCSYKNSYRLITITFIIILKDSRFITSFITVLPISLKRIATPGYLPGELHWFWRGYQPQATYLVNHIDSE